jgi:triacylglycerol lipase
MTVLLVGLRIVFLLVAVFFVAGALGHLLLFYERSAIEALRGERRPMTRERLRLGFGAWARESGLHVVMSGFWITGILPRGKLKSGAWLPREGESRPGRPVLLVPGYAMNRGTLQLLASRLERAGRPALAISLPYWKTVEELAQVVAEAAGELSRATGSDKIDVIAHSRGGVIARYWIQSMGGDQNVERYVSLGTAHRGTKVAAFGFGPSILQQFPGSPLLAALAQKPLPEAVEWHAVNGGEDCMILPPGNDELPAPGKNVRVERVGHTALLFSSASWAWIHAALKRSESEGLAQETGDDETADEAAERMLAQMSR